MIVTFICVYTGLFTLLKSFVRTTMEMEEDVLSLMLYSLLGAIFVG